MTIYRRENKQGRHDSGFTDVVPCGKCEQCLKNRAKAWSLRLYQEKKESTSSSFITLTYDRPKLSFNGHPTLVKKDFQDFMKRLRQRVKKEPTYEGKPLRYYMVGEYGELLQRPHYHAIMFNLPKKYTLVEDWLMAEWQNGLVHQGSVELPSIHYVTGYLHKQQLVPTHETDDRQKEFSLMSKGLGKTFLTKQMVRWLNANGNDWVFMPESNYKIKLPRYLKDKLKVKNNQNWVDKQSEYRIQNENSQAFKDTFKDFNKEYQKIKYTWDQQRKRTEKIQLQMSATKLHQLNAGELNSTTL